MSNRFLKAPAFWYQKRSWMCWLLSPLSWLYAAVFKLRFFLTIPYKSSCPVWCVGNLTLGGTGKTPVVQALRHELTKHSASVHVVSRGYGGTPQKTPILVNSATHSSFEVGDEPLLLSQGGPTWVCSNKKKAVQAAEKAGAALILLDDGYQNPTIYKDCLLLLLGPKKSLGNGCLFPAGPLRESFRSGLKRSDAVLQFPPLSDAIKMPHTRPHYQLKKHISLPNPPTKPLLAFCGLGFPDQFYSSLKNAGFEVKKTQSFPDHHRYTSQDESRLTTLATQLQCQLVCTQKDWVKLSPSFKNHVQVVALSIDLPDDLKTWINNKIPSFFRRKNDT